MRTDGATASTPAVGSDVARAEPATFVAVTTTRTVWPTSAAVATYVRAVAPGMSAQPWPAPSHRRHWYVKAIGVVPRHVPASAVSAAPSRGVPSMLGVAVA